MRLIDVLEKAPIGAKVFHRSMGVGVTGVVTHKTEKDFVLELSNGHALVERMDSTDAAWSLALTKRKVELSGWLHYIPERGMWKPAFFEKDTLPWMTGHGTVNDWLRHERMDTEGEIYE